MANVVWHEKLRIHLDLTRDDLGHEGLPGLWDTIYATDRLYAARSVPVSQRGLQCGGVCQEAGVIAWMHLRLRANGRREAVHEKAEDEARHTAPMSDEHKAYQERILLAATAAWIRRGLRGAHSGGPQLDPDRHARRGSRRAPDRVGGAALDRW